jgi:hypothetical protein
MNVLFLGAAPDAPRAEHNRFPAWLAEHRGASPLERLTASLAIHGRNRLIYCFLESDIKEFHLRDIVSAMAPRHSMIAVRNPTQGAACTALLASDEIDDETELFIVSLNEYLEVDLTEAATDFRSRDLDAATLVFRSVHPRYSFVRLGPGDLVVETAQGRPITDIATAGAFWFRRGKDFVEGAKDMIRKRDNINGTYYVCPALNQMILRGARIGVTWMKSSIYHPLKTEAQVYNFEHEI